jgi:hypothetical protein
MRMSNAVLKEAAIREKGRGEGRDETHEIDLASDGVGLVKGRITRKTRSASSIPSHLKQRQVCQIYSRPTPEWPP